MRRLSTAFSLHFNRRNRRNGPKMGFAADPRRRRRQLNVFDRAKAPRAARTSFEDDRASYLTATLCDAAGRRQGMWQEPTRWGFRNADSLLSVSYSQSHRLTSQFFIQGPERGSAEKSRGHQVNVDQTQPFSHQSIFFQEGHDFIMVCLDGGGKRPQQRKNFCPVIEAAARQLPDHEAVANHFAGAEQRLQIGMTAPEVLDPERCVDENHLCRTDSPPRYRLQALLTAA